MAKQDKRLKEIMQYRADGMVYALGVVEKHGVEALRKDIQSRRLTFLPLELSVEWINGIMHDIYSKIISCYNVTVYDTLHELFGFGKKRLHEFDEGFNERVSYLSTFDGYGEMLLTFEDMAKHYNDKYEMNVDMDAVRSGDMNNQNALGAGKVDLAYIVEICEFKGFDDAAKYFKEIMEV